MRCFVALAIPAEAREALAFFQQELRGAGADVKWVEKDNLHLTVKFLGEVAETRLERVRAGLARAVAGIRPFRLTLAGAGGFPSTARPRVVWVGVAAGREEMRTLWERVEEHLAQEGFEREERGFSPHLTLGRLRAPGGTPALVSRLTAVRERVWGEMRVEAILLMRSTLTPRGPIYETLATFALGEAGK